MTSKKTKFPRTLFQVTPSLNLREITLIGPATTGWGAPRYGYAADAKGKAHYVAHLYETRTEALDAARVTLRSQEIRATKAAEHLAKRRANFAKAEGAVA